MRDEARSAALRRRLARSRLFILVLALLSTIAPLSTDLYLPALPAIARSLRADEGSILLTLSSFFVGFGVGQLIWGPLSDRIGRRRPMVAGILLYILASVACALVRDATALIVWRFVQALGGCASPTLAQAMVRDVYDRDHGARALSMVQLIGALAPLAAPVIGGQVLLLFDWRAMFWILAGSGLVSLLGAAAVPETLPPGRRPRLRVRDLAQGYLLLLGHRRFLGYLLSSGSYAAGLFGYLSGISFVYIEYYKVRPEYFGFLFAINVGGMMAASYANTRLVLRLGSDRILRLATGLGGAAGLGLIAVGMTGAGGLPALVASLFCLLSLVGLIGANATAGALAQFPGRAGTASALMGTLRFGLGALAGAAISAMADGSPRPMVAVMGVLAIAAFVSHRLLVGRAAAEPPR